MTTLPDTTTPPPPVPLPVGSDAGTADTVDAGMPLTGHEAEIADLRRQLDDARHQATRFQQRLRATEDAHRADIAAIGEALIAEADERDWCTEYDEFVDRLNELLNVELPIRARAWEVIVPLRVTVRVDEARTEDEAVDRAREIAEDLESYLLRNDQVITANADSYHDFEASEADD